MDKIEKILIIMITIIIIITITIVYPIPKTITGTITDILPNDNDFGIIINHQIYWITYTNIHTNLRLYNFPNHTCTLTFNSNILNNNGSPNDYRHTINLTIEE